MKKTIKYNLLITVLQFVVFALLLFAVFFMKYSMDQTSKRNSDQGFVIEQNQY